MQRLLLIAAIALAAAGCSNPCRELGDRICKCTPTGSSVDSCKQEVDNVISSVDPTKDQDALCSDYLDTCQTPPGATFCEWLQTADGKEKCGLAYTPGQ